MAHPTSNTAICPQLEDKVAALEARNEQAVSENENLRDLLSRLQGENVRLKQSSFSFSVPKSTPTNPTTLNTLGATRHNSNEAPGSFGTGTPPPNMTDDPTLALYDSISSSSSLTSSPPHSQIQKLTTPLFTDPYDWNSLTAFDPAVLSLLDDPTVPQQHTATDASMHMDFSFGGGVGSAPSGAEMSPSPKMPYLTLTNNPFFMSFANAFDNSSPLNESPPAPLPAQVAPAAPAGYGFDVQWGVSGDGTGVGPGTLEELYGGTFLNPQGAVDYRVLLKSTPTRSLSPLGHAGASGSGNGAGGRSPQVGYLGVGMGGEGMRMDEDLGVVAATIARHRSTSGGGGGCPNDRPSVERMIAAEGPSLFVSGNGEGVRKGLDEHTKTIISCRGSTGLPQTAESDENVEVLTAWRSIVSNPLFKVGLVPSRLVSLPLTLSLKYFFSGAVGR
jgi:AP-1-like transcription factor